MPWEDRHQDVDRPKPVNEKLDTDEEDERSKKKKHSDKEEKKDTEKLGK